MISEQFLFAIQRSYNCAYPGCPTTTSKNEEDDFLIVRRQRLCSNVQCNFPRVTTRDVQIIAFSIFGPCCDDVIASALEQYLGPCNNGNEAVEEMSRRVKISILSWKLTLIENI